MYTSSPSKSRTRTLSLIYWFNGAESGTKMLSSQQTNDFVESGFLIGKTDRCKICVAQAGRMLETWEVNCVSARNIYRQVSGETVGALCWKFDNSANKCCSSRHLSTPRISHKAFLCVAVRLTSGNRLVYRTKDGTSIRTSNGRTQDMAMESSSQSNSASWLNTSLKSVTS